MWASSVVVGALGGIGGAGGVGAVVVCVAIYVDQSRYFITMGYHVLVHGRKARFRIFWKDMNIHNIINII